MSRRVALPLAALLLATLLAGCWGEAPGAFELPAEVVRPGPVALVSPAHGERLVAGPATFTWRLVANSTEDWSARLLLDGAPVDACPYERGRTTCAVPLEAGRTLRWSVEVLRADEEEPALANERVVRVNAPPGAPRIRAGDDGAVQVPLDLTFEWDAAPDPDDKALAYRVSVRDAATERVACEATTQTSCRLPWRLRAGETVTLEVRARDPLGVEGPAATATMTARRPVVMLHGWDGDETTWAIMAPNLVAAGYHVVDFDAPREGLQLLGYAPDAPNETIEEMTLTDVLPELRRALVDEGFAPDERIDIVGHSMGGLVGRLLVERYGHGAQVATLTMVGTPNRGSPMSGEWVCKAGPALWHGSCLQMEAGHEFLEGLGYAPRPAATSYATIGGGRDAVAPDKAVRLDGVPHRTVRNGCHSGTECAMSVEGSAVPLTGSREVRDELLRILDRRPGPAG